MENRIYGKYQIRLANADDNVALLGFLENFPSHGNIQIALDRSPDFFKSMKVEGEINYIILCEEIKTKKIVGVGSVSERKVYGAQGYEWVGYLGGLRFLPAMKKTTLLPRGYKFLHDLTKQMKSKVFFTTILEDNTHAIKVLTSGRAQMPHYKDVGGYTTFVFSRFPRIKTEGDEAFSFRAMREEDLPRVLSFIRQYSKNYSFIPFFENKEGPLFDVLVKSFLCLKNNEICGLFSVWDQSALRRWKVTGYSFWTKFTRPLINFYMALRSLPSLPAPGGSLHYIFLTPLFFQEKEALQFALSNLACVIPKKEEHIIVGLHEDDPLFSVFNSIPSYQLRSRLYLVYWDETPKDIKIPHIEIATI